MTTIFQLYIEATEKKTECPPNMIDESLHFLYTRDELYCDKFNSNKFHWRLNLTIEINWCNFLLNKLQGAIQESD